MDQRGVGIGYFLYLAHKAISRIRVGLVDVEGATRINLNRTP
jgi:hypothetical protein